MTEPTTVINITQDLSFGNFLWARFWREAYDAGMGFRSYRPISD